MPTNFRGLFITCVALTVLAAIGLVFGLLLLFDGLYIGGGDASATSTGVFIVCASIITILLAGIARVLITIERHGRPE